MEKDQVKEVDTCRYLGEVTEGGAVRGPGVSKYSPGLRARAAAPDPPATQHDDQVGSQSTAA